VGVRRIEDDARMGLLWTLIALVVAIIVVLTIVDIVRRHLGAKATTAWILVVIIVPIIGSIIYWAMRKPTQDEIDKAVAGDAELRAQAHRRP
jgi:uncharacterized PurR-regulated membrane protein YhhQ (DUF165 family)